MTLLISIEYRTRWGEQLVLRLGKRRIALQYADGGVWACAVERYAPAAQPAEYRYEVEREGVCIRSEWRPHTLRIPSREGVRTLRIRDRWQEMPSDTPFYSSAFTRGIFGRGKTGNPKKAAGNITLRVILPTLRPDETLAVAGSGRELGDWKRIVPMDDSRFPEWELTLHTAHRFEYKFLIADRKTLTPHPVGGGCQPHLGRTARRRRTRPRRRGVPAVPRTQMAGRRDGDPGLLAPYGRGFRRR